MRSPPPPPPLTAHGIGAAVTRSFSGGLNDESQFPVPGKHRLQQGRGPLRARPLVIKLWESLQPPSVLLQLKLALEEARHASAG